MHIAVIATTRHPLVEPYAGGQEAQTAVVLEGLRRLGHRVRLYARAGTDPALCDELAAYPEHAELSDIAKKDRVVQVEPGFLRDEMAMTWAMADLVKRPVEAIHNQSLHHLPLAMSAALPAPMMTTLHCPPFAWMEYGVAIADPSVRYIGVSRASARMWRLPSEPQVIYNGIDPEQFPLGFGGDGLVWVGRITPEKGTDLAIAAARAAGMPLRLIGPPSDPVWFSEVIDPLLGDGVEHMGHLPHDEAALIVGSSAACLVTPRWEEPFGLVAAEAMMCGTPVIALHRGGLPEIVAPTAGVLVPDDGQPEDALAEELAAAVPAALRLSRIGVHEHATTRFTQERMVREYDAVLHEMVAARVSP